MSGVERLRRQPDTGQLVGQVQHDGHRVSRWEGGRSSEGMGQALHFCRRLQGDVKPAGLSEPSEVASSFSTSQRRLAERTADVYLRPSIGR